MKAKTLLTSFISLLLLVGVSSCNNKEDSLYTEYALAELNAIEGYDGFIHEGEYVLVKGLTVAGQHGNTFIAYDDQGSVSGYLPVCEVVQKEKDNSIVDCNIVNVKGLVSSLNGRLQIVDAEVEVIGNDDDGFATYPHLALDLDSFSELGRRHSGLIVSGLYLELVSFNGATSFTPGTDLNLTVVYAGDEAGDPYNQINLTLFGDLDKEYISYLNAFFFGTDKEVSWISPISGNTVNTLEAGYQGLKEGDTFSGMFHLFYDYELGFSISDLVGGYLEYIDFYSEDNEMSSLLDNMYLNRGSYKEEATYYRYDTTPIKKEEYTQMSDKEKEEYLETASFNYWASSEVEVDDETYLELDYSDSNDINTKGNLKEITYFKNMVNEYGDWGSYEAYYESQEDFKNDNPYISYFNENQDWTYWIDSLYSLGIEGYTTSFKRVGTTVYSDSDGTQYSAYLYSLSNTFSLSALWDAVISCVGGSSFWFDILGYDMPELSQVMLVPELGYLDIVYELGDIYNYQDDSLYYVYELYEAEITFDPSLIGE